jgi:FKBP-type peptidyl-prolyl cis-trans isomerase FkpA
MRNLVLMTVAGLLMAVIACNQQPGKIKTEHGYFVTNHTNKGGEKPQVGDMIKVHVKTVVGDSVVQDTRKISPEPREIQIPDLSKMTEGRKVPAIFSAAMISGEGDSITVFQEIDSLIQRQLPESLKKEKYVRYEIMIAEVTSKAEQEKKTAEAQAVFNAMVPQINSTIDEYNSGKLASKLTTTPSGVKMYTIEKGAGAALNKGDQVKVHYYGSLKDKKMFDNSFQRGEPLPFALGVGQMIPGFDEGTQQLNHGGKAYLFIPGKLGYGEEGTPDGSIPPNAELIFYIEVQ